MKLCIYTKKKRLEDGNDVGHLQVIRTPTMRRRKGLCAEPKNGRELALFIEVWEAASKKGFVKTYRHTSIFRPVVGLTKNTWVGEPLIEATFGVEYNPKRIRELNG